MTSLSEREVLKSALQILTRVFREWVRVERRTSGLFTNSYGQAIRIGKPGEADIGGWVTRGVYIGKPLAIEVKRSDFRPSHISSKKDRKRFLDQCNYLRRVNYDGGVGLWINNSSDLFLILTQTLIYGAKATLDGGNRVTITRVTRELTNEYLQENQ